MSRAVAASIASLIRRRFCGRCCLSLFFDQLRPCSTQALTQGIEQTQVPRLLVPSQRNPQTCSLFSLNKKSTEDGKDQNFLKFESQIHLPKIAAWDKTLCIGSSDGILFFTTKTHPVEVFALNPLTGTYLPLPPPATLRPLPYPVPHHPLHESKTLLSPSRDIVILNRIHFVDFARLDDNNERGCWMPLPDNFRYVHDFTFHKGLLYAIDNKQNLGVFDFDNPSSPIPLSGDESLVKYGGDHLFCRWLVESPDGKDLFYVFRKKSCPPPFPPSCKVFKLNRNGKWKRMRSIGDIAIFVGIHQSMSLSARDFPDTLKPNSIYFTESRKVADSVSPWAPGITGIFSLDDESIHLFEETLNVKDAVHLPPRSPHLWFTPTIAF